MAVQLPPNSTGAVVDTITTVGAKERQVVIRPIGGQFSKTHTPAAATQATISQAAAGAGVSNIAVKGSYSITTTGTAQPAVVIALRDGATGAGTILWSKTILLAINSIFSETVDFPDLLGTANTAMTLEFSAAGAAATVQSVNLMGYTNA